MPRLVATLVLAAAASVCTAAELKRWEGGAAPPLALEDLSGRSHNLTDYKGKVVLVNFWATWCEPCRAEMPELQQLAQSLRDRPFTLYSVNLQEDAPTIDPFRGQVGFTQPVLLDEDGSVTRGYGVRALPATFLIDQQGILREQRLGPLVPGDADTAWSSVWVMRRVESLLGTAAR